MLKSPSQISQWAPVDGTENGLLLVLTEEKKKTRKENQLKAEQPRDTRLRKKLKFMLFQQLKTEEKHKKVCRNIRKGNWKEKR